MYFHLKNSERNGYDTETVHFSTNINKVCLKAGRFFSKKCSLRFFSLDFTCEDESQQTNYLRKVI